LNFFRDYRCSAKYDSAEIYFSILHNHFLVNQDMGVSRLAKIVGRVLGNENKEKMQLELAEVYLKQLKDLDEAIRISQSIISNSTDSSVLGKAYHIMGESYRRKSQLAFFSGMPGNTYHSKSQEALKNSMVFLNFIENPDSLSFLFLLETAGPQIEGIPTQKKIQFWEHFQSNYPDSYFAEKAAVILSRLYLKANDSEKALRELAPLRNSGDEKIAGNAYFNMGKIYYERNELDNAAEILKEFLLQIKEHHFRANGFGLLAKIREKQENYQEAAQFWARLRERYNYAPAAIAAKTRIPEIFLKADEYQAVIDYTKPYTNFNVSEDHIVRKLQQIPESSYYFFQGKALYHLRQFGEGRQKLLDYLYFNTDDKYRDESLFTLAQIALEEDDQNGALLHLDMVTRNQNSPFFLQATARAADIYFEQKKYDKAQNLYSQLIEKTGNTEQSISYMVKEMICLINQGQLKLFDSRLSSFKKFARDDANYRNYRANFEFEIGKYYYQNKNFNSAIDRFQRIIDDYKKSDFADDAEYYLGLTYTTLNKVDQAMQVLSRFVERYPNSPLRPNIYVTLGSLYFRAEKRNLAVGSFQKAVEIAQEPETRKLALSNLISLYRDLGLWDGVLSQARVYAEEFHNADDLIDKKIVIGIALIHLNRYSEAIDHLKDLKFQANSDQEPEIQFYIGEAYFNAGQYENAIREFVKIPLLSKQTKLQWEASALYYSGQAYEKMGRTNDAIRMYQEIVERPGILVDLKREAQKRIDQLKSSG
jgi:tetratricopeptide (TPR) repeat protein